MATAVRIPTVYEQPRNLPLLVTEATCAGKTYIVTGSNTGLGFEAAQHLVALGAAKVIMAVRNLEAGNKAKARIEAATGKTGVAEVWHLDLGDYPSVKAFAQKVIDELPRVDAIIQNAAVASIQRELVNGQNQNIAVNVLGTFLLTFLLIPKLIEMGRQFDYHPRIVFVGSTAGFQIDPDVWKGLKDDPLEQMKTTELGSQGYRASKLVEFFTARHLTKLLPVSKTGIVMHTVCPGLCATELIRHAPPEWRDAITKLHKTSGRTAEDGSRAILHALVVDEETHGQFLQSCEPGEQIPDWTTNEDGVKTEKLVWHLVTAELEKIEPGVVKNVV
ncbi:hypothetical protein QBC47DRAFT_439190 [Echria macrotheca]|uniref:Ketoreductase domain-containing protein n=1 Tax=Echria macrotheca TaxID=438768 RepID=A0AAJ0F0G4_9PEZI|nr:hypothetical protein QBC47DRAFT_439190 [Echria macrotheca]